MADNSALKDNAFIPETWCNTRINRVDRCSYMWTIHNYMEYHYYSEKQVTSSTFKSTTNKKYEWYLSLCSPKSEVISLFLVLNSKAEWCKNVLVKCEMSTMNDNRERSNITKQVHYNKLTKSDAGNVYYFLFTSFLTTTDISNTTILADDKLTICCEFQFIFTVDPNLLRSVETKSVLAKKNDVDCTLSKDLENLCLNGTLSDFVISVDGKDHPVHKTILAARSPVFATLFMQDMKEQKENRLEITDMRESVVEEMLKYIYTGRVSGWHDTAFELLQAAEKYDLQQLKNICQYSIIEKLSVENVVNSLLLADLYNAPLLKDQAVQFMKIFLTKVMKTESWCKFKESRLFDEVFVKLFE